MQTFITSTDFNETARHLDRQRLGKQRVEAIQIARTLLNPEAKKGWVNHPAVKMWRGWEGCLVWEYLPAMIKEWERRGYNGPKCKEHLTELKAMISPSREHPSWITEEFITSHKSNLIRKNSEYYQPLFPNVPENLEYIWPV